MARNLMQLVALAFILVAPASNYAQKERKDGPEKGAATPLDGVWEQLEVQDAKGKVSYSSSFVMFNRGTESHWVVSHSLGSLVKPQKLTVGAKGAFEFVNQYDNLTIRGLYETT